jgi:hypothetical protein
MRNPNVLISLGILIFFLAACGAGVNIDREGQGGSDTSDAGPSDPCQVNCRARVQGGCLQDEAACVAGCEMNVANVGECASIYEEVLICVGENPTPPDCTGPTPNCEDEIAAFHLCVASAPCKENGQCEASALHCNCKNDCSGAQLETDCTLELDGPGTCTCTFNGKVVGSCTPAGPKCNNLEGCCAAVFAASH